MQEEKVIKEVRKFANKQPEIEVFVSTGFLLDMNKFLFFSKFVFSFILTYPNVLLEELVDPLDVDLKFRNDKFCKISSSKSYFRVELSPLLEKRRKKTSRFEFQSNVYLLNPCNPIVLSMLLVIEQYSLNFHSKSKISLILFVKKVLMNAMAMLIERF